MADESLQAPLAPSFGRSSPLGQYRRQSISVSPVAGMERAPSPIMGMGTLPPGTAGFRRGSPSPVLGQPRDEEPRPRDRSPLNRDVDHSGPLPLPTPVRLVGGRRSPLGDTTPSSSSTVEELTGLEKRRVVKAGTLTSKFTQAEQELIAKQYKQHVQGHSLDNAMDPAGLKQVLALWSVPPAMALLLFGVFDRDGSQALEFDEFMVAMGVFIKGSFDEKLKFFFNVWDVDKSGTITKDELVEMLSLLRQSTHNLTENPEEEAQRLLARMDVDDSGEISFAEFSRGVMRIPTLASLFHTCFGEF